LNFWIFLYLWVSLSL